VFNGRELGWVRLPGGRKPGWADGDAPRCREQERQADDVLPPYTRDQLATMNDRFVHRLERAFKSGRERRASAASHMGGHRMAPIALTDDQLATLRQFATPIPPRLRDAFLRSVARRLAAVEVGDGTMHAACAAAQREVIDGARVCE
jgi:hypothetical protein